MEQLKSTQGSISQTLVGVHVYHGVLLLFKYSFTLVFVVLASTYVFTSCRFYIGCSFENRRLKGLEPLTLPYFIPWVGTGLSIVLNPHKFYQTA